MKIAIAHMRHAKTGGVELFLNSLSRYLAEQGDEVTILCRSHDEPSHPAIKFVKLRSFSIGKTHRIWNFARDVERHTKSADYDVVISLGGTWYQDILRIGSGTRKHLVSSMGRKPSLRDRLMAYIEQKAMKKGNYKHIIANSYKSASEVQDAYGVPSEDVSVIHNFVDTKKFDRNRVAKEASELKLKLGVDGSEPVYLFLGTGYSRKGLKPTLEAFSHLDFPAKLIVVGRESREAEYKEYAKKLGIYDKCHFMGEQTTPELYYSIADCYVLPAYYEPFGFAVLEALACGTPVIITENCGAKEVVNSEVASVIGSEVSVDEIVNAMRNWSLSVVDDQKREEIRKVALQHDVQNVLKMYSDTIKRFIR